MEGWREREGGFQESKRISQWLFQAFIACRFLDRSHSDWCEVVETVTQSEVRQKEKISYIHAYIYRIYKNGIDDLICKGETETPI